LNTRGWRSRKVGANTAIVAEQLAKAKGVPDKDAGNDGLKDCDDITVSGSASSFPRVMRPT